MLGLDYYAEILSVLITSGVTTDRKVQGLDLMTFFAR